MVSISLLSMVVLVSMNSILILLWKCCNYLYLIECFLEEGILLCKVDEELVISLGKMMFFD